MKILKTLFKLVVVLVVLAVVALLALPLWFGPVAKTAANAVVPGIVKTDFHMGHIALNPYTGRFELGDTQLANPEGYSEKYAVKLGDIVFDCDPLSVAGDVIHIEEITVKDVFASVTTKDGVMNFKQIQYNVAGGKEKYEAAQAEAVGYAVHTTKFGQVQQLSRAWFADLDRVRDPAAEAAAAWQGPALVIWGQDDADVHPFVPAHVAATLGAQTQDATGEGHGYGFYSEDDAVRNLVASSAADFFAANLK